MFAFRIQNLFRTSLFLLAFLGPQRASAEFAVCNQTFDVVNVAVGQSEGGTFITRGWWTIGPNQCANVIKEVLSARYVYVFAQDVFGKEILQGATPMCIATSRFEIRGETNCLSRGHLTASYLEVDTLKTERWTLFLKAPQ
ncbi:Uncharacterized membrane protein [Cognatiyoonia koreensis]|uniref:Uncharacterized membrane protein n=1 Tax=Cognatiyoonia koreensis TaxID=364200 RepID=A0A1I0RGV4_9RHOB|nr:DUF1036 domain-containing protein [Cognatiyoonia koreensis]SEW40062.1 Uncharacterized membrane protein [Cognatiyoonia koreensis]